MPASTVPSASDVGEETFASSSEVRSSDDQALDPQDSDIQAEFWVALGPDPEGGTSLVSCTAPALTRNGVLLDWSRNHKYTKTGLRARSFAVLVNEVSEDLRHFPTRLNREPTEMRLENASVGGQICQSGNSFK